MRRRGHGARFHHAAFGLGGASAVGEFLDNPSTTVMRVAVRRGENEHVPDVTITAGTTAVEAESAGDLRIDENDPVAVSCLLQDKPTDSA